MQALMPPAFLESIQEFFRHPENLDRALRLAWERLAAMYIGEKLAMSTLLFVTVLGSIAAVNRYFSGHFGMPAPRKTIKVPKRAKGFGVKHLALLGVALLPGGMVGMFTIYHIMGSDHWRRDAFIIVGGSAIPGLFLVSMRMNAFPWPHLRDAVYLSGLVGLVFALLQCWALIKLLREWWGEPDECVAWWPPLALCIQVFMLCVGSHLILGG